MTDLSLSDSQRAELAEQRIEELEFQVRRMTQEYEEASDSLRRENEKGKRATAERSHYKNTLMEIVAADPVDMALDPGWASRQALEALKAWEP